MINGSRRLQLMILICQTVGMCNLITIPLFALSHGTLGCMVSLFVVYILLGIPLVYMELIIGQFTGRDCLEVWKIRPFLSHTSYLLILWQVLIFIHNHILVCFAVHYLLISFENPIPYYECGPWSTGDCNILNHNYTLNEDCLKQRRVANYCDHIYTTFPEHQYWKGHVLKGDKSFYIAWRACLASGLVCLLLYLSCFKRKHSLKWFVSWLPIYPILVFVPIMMGSMLQKGLVVKFEEALDLDFSNFAKRFRLSYIIQQVVYNLGVGSGVTFNFASSASFRTNCFSNSVIIVIITAIFSVLVVCTISMMTCPYAYQFSISTGAVMLPQTSMMFEKIPRLLYQYEHRFYWLILVYSCYAVIGLCTSMLIFYNFLELIATRNEKVAFYPGLTCFVGVAIIFLTTIPLLSIIGTFYDQSFKRYITLVSTLFATIECIVFILSYGIHTFSEDVHFMLGIQPSFYMKTAWVLASGFLAYAIGNELIHYYNAYTTTGAGAVDKIGIYILLLMCGLFVTLCVERLLVEVCRKRFKQVLKLDPSWGPKSGILQRSRAMFSAQAMTKEYMYRQYHLQAGIISRQKNSNKRNIYEFDEQRFSL